MFPPEPPVAITIWPERRAAVKGTPMLQSLLKERFLAAVHREAKEMPAYDMVAAKGGVKIHAVDAPWRALPADRLLSRTGMDGSFFYSLSYSPLSTEVTCSAADPGPPDFFVAVQQQLGLKLEPKNESVEMLIVDHAERVPTQN